MGPILDYQLPPDVLRGGGPVATMRHPRARGGGGRGNEPPLVDWKSLMRMVG